MKSLAADGYFATLQQRMINTGFALMAKVQIDHTECPYHVPADQARSTNLFFHLPRKSIMVHMEYLECAYPGEELRGYWRITLYVQFLPYNEILDKHPRILDCEECWGDVPVMGTGTLDHPGFRFTTGLGLNSNNIGPQIGMRYEQEQGHEFPLPVLELLGIVKGLTEPFKPYVGNQPFRHLRVSDFAPTYAFSGQNNHYNQPEQEKTERLFWSKFDWTYARHFIHHPWGAVVFDRQKTGPRRCAPRATVS